MDGTIEVAPVPSAEGRSRSTLPHWLRSRAPEIALFGLGFLLRGTMRWNYDATWGYDAPWHWEVVEWILRHGRIPWPNDIFEAQHPPLFYVLAAILYRHGVSHSSIAWVPIASGTIRLALIWAGLEMYLPSSRTARLAALALAAVLPASVQIDGMVYPEAMSCMWLTAAMLVMPLPFWRSPRSRWRWTILLGIFMGLALLTKVSGIAIAIALGTAVLTEFVWTRRSWHRQLAKLCPWAASLLACFALSGWYYLHNYRAYGKPFVTSFDFEQHWLVAASEKQPYLERRPIRFLIGWSPSIFWFPYSPSAWARNSRFFPVAVASTFVDYWNYSYSGVNPNQPSEVPVQGRPLTRAVLKASQLSAVGGTVIFLATVLAWFGAMRHVLARRDMGRLALLLVPLSTLMAAIHFAIAYPIDSYGVVKGVYMQFGAPPLYGLFGLSVAWSRQKLARLPLAALLLISLWAVASYSLYCRMRVPLVPL